MADKKNEERDSFVPFYRQGAHIYMSLKISKDGLSREEDVDVLRGMYEEFKGRDAGWKVFEEVYGGKKKVEEDDD